MAKLLEIAPGVMVDKQTGHLGVCPACGLAAHGDPVNRETVRDWLIGAVVALVDLGVVKEEDADLERLEEQFWRRAPDGRCSGKHRTDGYPHRRRRG